MDWRGVYMDYQIRVLHHGVGWGEVMAEGAWNVLTWLLLCRPYP